MTSDYIDEMAAVSRETANQAAALGFLSGLLIGLVIGGCLTLVGLLAVSWGLS